MEKKQPPVLIPEIKIQARVQELAQQINADYQGKEITAVCVLKGSFIFYTDIIRAIEVPITCEFLGASSYGSEMVSSGEVKITLDINEPLEGKHVLVFEDIVDQGLTLRYVQNILKTRGPASLKTCALLLKPKKLRTNVEVDYVGFQLEDEFVVGYGMDLNEQYRGLPYIGYIEETH